MKQYLMAAAVAALVAATAPARAETTLTFYYPVGAAGPITQLIDQMAVDFTKENPDIKVKPVYSGSYTDTTTKVLTAVKGGDAPQLTVTLSTDMFTLIDEDAVVPFDDLVKTDAEKAWLKGFWPGLMANSQTGGKTWGIPFQRSTIVQYWNKDAFKEVGLDPNHAPATWAELTAAGEKLVKHDGDKTSRWGLQIPSSGLPYWLFQGLAVENGVTLANDAGNQVSFDKPAVVEALNYWLDMSRKYKFHPPGIVDWGTTPTDFINGRVAMIWTTTGNLTNIKNNAKFDFGVSILPANKQPGSPTGGGNFYIFKKDTAEQKAAALKFIEWATAPDRAAAWAIATGYVAVTPAAYETDAMKKYIAGFPAAAVARDQMKYAAAEFTTHDGPRVTQAFNDSLQAALTGTKPADVAMADAQKEADRILKQYK